MVRGLFFKLFPPPQYLEQRATGLDISDRSIKYCDLSPDGNLFKVQRFGELALPLGVIEAGQIKNKSTLSSILSKLRADLGWRSVALALPEEEAYIVEINLPAMPRHDLRQSIELQLEEYVPLPADSVVFDYEVVARPEAMTGYEVAVSVFPRTTLLEYCEVFETAGLVLRSAEVEAQAMARALFPPAQPGTILVVDFGKTRTGFFVVSVGRVLASRTLASIGGDLLTTSIQKNLGVPAAQAEELKVTRGLLQTPGDNQLLFALVPIISVLRDELTKFAGYWNTHGVEHHQSAPAIERIVICGGQGTLPGLVEYLAGSLDLPVVLGNIWTNLTPRLEKVPPIKQTEALKYATAVGLALKNFASYD